MLLLEHVRSFLLKLPSHTGLFVGYSGGRDSSVLLDILSELEIPFTAVHIHHQLSSQADAWQVHCKCICENKSIPFLTQKVSIAKQASVEDAARKARYDAFYHLIPAGSVLLLAHHQDDQAETFLLQLLRGAGPYGLASMPSLKRVHSLWMARPLLSMTRAMIEEYAAYRKLKWIDDDSNVEEKYTRNYIRQQVIPFLKQRWPQAQQALARSAECMAETLALQDEIAEQDQEFCENKERGTLRIASLKTLSPTRRHQLLRHFLKNKKGVFPGYMLLKEIEEKVIGAREDAMPLVEWDELHIRRYQDELYCFENPKNFDQQVVIAWDGKSPCQLANGEWVTPIDCSGAAQLRFRSEGAVALVRDHHHSLKKIFQESNIPPWERERVPLLYVDDELKAMFWNKKWVVFK